MLRSKIKLQLWKVWMLSGIMIRENIKSSAKESIGYYELNKHKPAINKGCSKLLKPRK
jgi:hypothetical protein